jgi:hypothetical protein
MNESLNINNKDYYLFSFSASLVLHIIVLVFCFILLKNRDDGYSGRGIAVQMIQNENSPSGADKINKSAENKQEQQKIVPDKKESYNQNKAAPLNASENKTYTSSGYYNFNGSGNDTAGLVQIYSEKTLNVKIKYPVGWTFVDQDRHNKLDGVTFWANNGIFNPPPYIFLEVKEKYLFNPSRFKFITKLENSIAYYNDPEELEGQVSQIFYIRTETDEDYSIKLIMNGRDTFLAFQPIFFAMIKSFNFGKSLF